jgi:O-antigen/teichoic acid export membrane protein
MYILSVLIDYGSYVIGVQNISINRENPKELAKIFWNTYFMKLVLLIALLLTFFVIIFAFDYFENSRLLLSLSAVFLVSQFINPLWFLQGVEDFKSISLINIVSKIPYVLLVLFLIKSKNDYVYINAYLGFSALFANVIGFYYAVYRYKLELQFFKLENISKLLKNDFKFCLSQFFLALKQYAPIVIVGYFCNNYIAGQFRIIEQIIILFRTYIQMFFRYVYSEICYKISNDIKSGITTWKIKNGLNLFLVILISAIIFFKSNEILIFFHVKTSDLNTMNHYLSIALMMPVLFVLNNALEQIVFALDKKKLYINVTVLTTILAIFLLTILTSLFNILGTMYALIITEIVILIFYIYIFKKEYKIKL